MNNRILWLRICYWVGAIADGLAALRMLFPTLSDSPDVRYALGIGAALMLGWTCVLIWADKRPLERKGVLMLTVFPVVTGIILADIFAYSHNVIALAEMVLTVLVLATASVVFIVSYFRAAKVE